MSETMPESSVPRIVDRLDDLTERPGLNLGRGVVRDLIDLWKNLREIDDVWHRIPVAETVHQAVRSWMIRVDSTAKKMEDVLDEWEISMAKPKAGRVFDKVVNGKATFSKELERMKKVKEVIGESESLLREAGLISHYAPRTLLLTSLFPEVPKKPELVMWEEPRSGIYGRRSDMNSLVDYMLRYNGTKGAFIISVPDYSYG